MVRQQTVKDILEWIELNLEKPLLIDDIARKSGYSRRNILLLVRNMVGIPLGSYIRQRRLCRAAMLVRLTSMTIGDIALRLHFDSQQTFSREFKKRFGCTPREYRKRDDWDLESICTNWLTRQTDLPDCHLIMLTEMHFSGSVFSYHTTVGETPPKDEITYRRTQLTKQLARWKKDIYCMNRFQNSSRNINAIAVESHIGTLISGAKMPTIGSFSLPGGMYAMFHYEGPWAEYVNLPRRFYLEALPAAGLVRTQGCDLEHFRAAGTRLGEKSDWVDVDLYIPVRNKTACVDEPVAASEYISPQKKRQEDEHT
ncbi:helix-turn-helix domain-containing protein [Klebsiella sp. I138]|uniref:helix-turn-helix domain-containing protein n=1 Tax=Klebsiella sp. I138 TaxID=2755385 RepID=UPI003DA85579